MLSSVGRESAVVDCLADYITRGRRKPTELDGRPAQTRKPNRPGERVPGEEGRVAASSARPSKRTNDTVCYTRMQCCLPWNTVHPHAAEAGDLLFVSRVSGTSTGCAHNRMTTSASLAHVNAMLSGRLCEGYNALSATKRPLQDWRSSVALLKDWTPDGVLLSRDDGYTDSFGYVQGSTAFNVAVHGPCVVHNRKGGPSGAGRLIDTSLCMMDSVYILLICRGGGDGLPHQPANELVRDASEPDTLSKAAAAFLKETDGGTAASIASAKAGDEVPEWLGDAAKTAKKLGAKSPGSMAFTYKVGGSGSLARVASGAHTVGCDVSLEDLQHTVAVWHVGRVLDTDVAHGKMTRINLEIRELPMEHARKAGMLGEKLGSAHYRSQLQSEDQRRSQTPAG